MLQFAFYLNQISNLPLIIIDIYGRFETDYMFRGNKALSNILYVYIYIIIMYIIKTVAVKFKYEILYGAK